MSEPVTLDLRYLGHHGAISVFLVATGDGGFVLLDSGPASTAGALAEAVAAEGFSMKDLRAVFLTHIHLDHGSAAGTLARSTGCEVWAHPRGLPHLRDPDHKLMPSALRIYGERLERMFGIMEAVPADQLRSASDGQPIRVGELELVGWFTPGHAKHHVVWHVGDAVATGDVAGIRLNDKGYVVPPMPPPDIDVPAWRRSLDVVRRLQPGCLLLTHFGKWTDVTDHLDQLDDRLRRWDEASRQVVNGGGGVDEIAARLTELDELDMERESVPVELRQAYRAINPMEEAAFGLFRYHSTREGSEGIFG
jgi:glyoxylase-like metal-dependent hydrolase (beta-lactamase superfamily II)